jgi:hypothetical protein
MAIDSASFITLEDGTRKKKSGTLITEGQAVKIDANGELAPATAAAKVYGIAKTDSNAFRDFAVGEFGAFGTGQLTVVVKGILLLSQSVYNQVEVDQNTTTSAAPTTIKVFDDAQVYTPGEALYVDAGGLITNQTGGGKASLLGKCLRTPLQTGGMLEIEVDAPAASAAAELA